MSTKRNHEGYLLLDHRNSPGAPEEMTAKTGLPTPQSGKNLFEAPTYTCSHCCRIVIINPLRTRPHEYCAKCDHYICHLCSAALAASGECKPFKQLLDETQDKIIAAQAPSYTGTSKIPTILTAV